MRDYYYNFSDPLFILRNQILIVNIMYTTSKRLILLDENEEPIHFDNSFDLPEADSESDEEGEEQEEDSERAERLKDKEFHVLRFETYAQDLDWILTDFDYVLDGNPYYPKK